LQIGDNVMTTRPPPVRRATFRLARIRSAIGRFLQQEDLNFLLTNRIPRRSLTLFMGWLSRIEHPWIARPGIALWKFFAGLDLREAREQQFASLQQCFTRELLPGVRPIDGDPAVCVSPCDAEVGACGVIERGMALQAKGFAYALADLLGDEEWVRHYEGGQYATLRLRASMYHRFHAPHDCRVRHVRYYSGDTWNVNPIALRRVAALFCKNERAAIRCELLQSGHIVTLVPVAAILVASIRLRFLDVLLHLRYRGPNDIGCDAAFGKGEEMGWFEHGSTILVFVPPGFERCAPLQEGQELRMGQPLFRMHGKAHSHSNVVRLPAGR
jgi:phosphatidylserine decarboxylase